VIVVDDRAFRALCCVFALVAGWVIGGLSPSIQPPGPSEIALYPVGGRAGSIAVGGGAAWVITPDDGWGVLRRVDATTGFVERLPATRGSSWPTFGDGYVWAPCAGTTDNPCGGPLILKLDPTTGVVLDRIDVGSTGFPAFAADGLWVSGQSGLARIDPSTEQVDEFGGRGFSWIGSVRGSVWEASGDRIRQFDPSDGSTLRSFHLNDPCFVNVTGDAVWAETCRPDLDAAGPDKYFLIRINASSGEVRRVPIATPTTMVTAAGRLWMVRVEDSGESAGAAIESIDPSSMRPSGDRLSVPIAAGRWGVGIVGVPTIFAVADGSSLWLSNTGEDDLIRVGLPV